jgi:hypothetical protein
MALLKSLARRSPTPAPPEPEVDTYPWCYRGDLELTNTFSTLTPTVEPGVELDKSHNFTQVKGLSSLDIVSTADKAKLQRRIRFLQGAFTHITAALLERAIYVARRTGEDSEKHITDLLPALHIAFDGLKLWPPVWARRHLAPPKSSPSLRMQERQGPAWRPRCRIARVHHRH